MGPSVPEVYAPTHLTVFFIIEHYAVLTLNVEDFTKTVWAPPTLGSISSLIDGLCLRTDCDFTHVLSSFYLYILRLRRML